MLQSVFNHLLRGDYGKIWSNSQLMKTGTFLQLQVNICTSKKSCGHELILFSLETFVWNHHQLGGVGDTFSSVWNGMHLILITITFVNPLNPKISVHILHTVLYKFPDVLTGRICLPNKSIFRWWSFLLFLWPQCLIPGWHCKEKLDASHSKGQNVLTFSWINAEICFFLAVFDFLS